MAIWEEFENKCTEYLNKEFEKYADFLHQGGADSTTPDILVNTMTGKSFYIEAKHCPAQCGQFVLLPNLKTRKFDYSSLNANPINSYSKAIMEHMNSSFDEFREAGTKGKEIIMPNSEDIFSSWIIQIYKAKGVKFFITNSFNILHIDDFQNFFNITAKYRIKRSGSSNVGVAHKDIVRKYILDRNYNIENMHTIGKKLFVSSIKDLHNQRFIIGETEYMFSKRNDKYEVRKLSNTYNANVIFSITVRNNNGISKDKFVSFLV